MILRYTPPSVHLVSTVSSFTFISIQNGVLRSTRWWARLGEKMRRDDSVVLWSNFRENDPHNIFLERQILVCECQQNAVEFSDEFRKKKTTKQNISIPLMKDTALVNSYWTSRFLRDCNWGNEESRIIVTYRVKCFEAKLSIRLLLSLLLFQSFCVTLCTYLEHSFRRNESLINLHFWDYLSEDN